MKMYDLGYGGKGALFNDASGGGEPARLAVRPCEIGAHYCARLTSKSVLYSMLLLSFSLP